MDAASRNAALDFHRRIGGKVLTIPAVNVRKDRQLALAYIPGSLPACEEIQTSPNSVFDYTGKGNRIAVVSNGSSVPGIGKARPEAALPIVEGQCLMMKIMGDVNAYPMVVDASGTDEIATACRMIAPSVGAIDLECIADADSSRVMDELRDSLGIPLFCDKRHGSAVVVLAGVTNALRLTEVSISDARIVICGDGAAADASADLLRAAGASNVAQVEGDALSSAIAGAHIFVGLSGTPITADQIKSMDRRPTVFALSSVSPAISYGEAKDAGVFIYASRSADAPNQMLNIHSFAGLVRGSLEVRAKRVTEGMLLAAASALSNMIDSRHISPDEMMPRMFGTETMPRVAEAAAQAAISDGASTSNVPHGVVYQNTWNRMFGSESIL